MDASTHVFGGRWVLPISMPDTHLPHKRAAKGWQANPDKPPSTVAAKLSAPAEHSRGSGREWQPSGELLVTSMEANGKGGKRENQPPSQGPLHQTSPGLILPAAAPKA